jgi:hypothetical protein
MKIKIRPDESGTPGTPGTSEWAAMNDWLADLREDGEDGQAMPDRERYAEPDRERYAEPDRERYRGTSSEGYATAHGAGHGSPADGGYIRQAREREPRAMASGPAPRHGYMSRTRAGTRARTGPPAEATAVRAVIGDELRTPTAWCEMGSCISCHADRSALGEADIRARAIGAGWRIDALGRLACPRCLQTSASFRATRPVVPWDRATAISMAARATARGNRTTGPAGANAFGTQRQANGRGTRHPAHGRR